jgi:hypothetical protein
MTSILLSMSREKVRVGLPDLNSGDSGTFPLQNRAERGPLILSRQI